MATRIGSIACRPSQQRCTARTILLRSTGSLAAVALGHAHRGGGGRRRQQEGGVVGCGVGERLFGDGAVVVLHGVFLPCVMHAAACPSQAAEGTRATAMPSSRPRPLGRTDHREKRGVADRRRRVPGRRAAGTCVTSHLPPEIPRPAPRGVHRAAVGRSSDSWTRGEERVMRKEERGKRASLVPLVPRHSLLVPASPTCRRFPGCAPVRVATSFPPTAAGQCRDGIIRSAPASLFIRRRKPTEPTATTYRGWSGWSTLHIQLVQPAGRRQRQQATDVVRRKPIAIASVDPDCGTGAVSGWRGTAHNQDRRQMRAT